MAICDANPTAVFSGIPSEAGSGPIPGFMELISSWSTGIPLNNIWSVEFEAPTNTLDIDEPVVVADQWQLNVSAAAVGTKTVNKTFGWYKTNMLANSIKIVGESIKLNRVGSANSEGYLRGLVSQGREDFGYLDIAFIETNISFVDFVLRPWLIAVTKESLIARKNDTKRVNITCTMYGLAGKDKPAIPRKKFIFFNSFPQSVDGEEYNFTDSDVNLRKATFAFTHYAMVSVSNPGASMKCNE